MIQLLATVFGGIGLFLLGMVLMTDGLKALAGDALRRMLERFTGSRLSAVATGAAVTALVQSSSATTLATIGFVSAGLLGFHNAIGVIIGANLGTTSTGWIVSVLGLKYSIGAFSMPLIGVGALLRLLGRDRLAQTGSVLAGFGLIFFGIDTLQTGMGGLAERIDLARYSAPGVGTRLLLVLIGAVMTVLMQSSSAAVATTLTALASGAIGIDQAAALVIGQNVGTTAKAGLAAIGASIPAKRTALVHLVFNLGSGLIAFILLPWFVAGAAFLTGDEGSGSDHAVTIAAFHSVFNVLGVIVFVPLIPQLAKWSVRLLPEHRSTLVRHLDPSLREVPALAVAAAATTLRGVLVQSAAAAGRGLLTPLRTGHEQFTRWREAAEAAGELVERLPSPEPATLERLKDAMHLLDHVRQFVRAAGKPSRYTALDLLPELRARADALGRALIDCASSLESGEPFEIERIVPFATEAGGGGLRAAVLSASATGDIEVDDALAALNAQRWLERLSHHARRALYYLGRLDSPTTSASQSSDDPAASTS